MIHKGEMFAELLTKLLEITLSSRALRDAVDRLPRIQRATLPNVS